MSIWATQWHAEIPGRSQYGPEQDEEPGAVFVCTSGMSDLIRLSIHEQGIEGKVRGVSVYITSDEARQIAQALLDQTS